MKVAIVVPIRRASRTVADTLTDLLGQCPGHDAEVIAVVSESDPTRQALEQFKDPHLRVLIRPGTHAVPQLRRDGALASRAEWVIITEDHCRFPKNWLGEVLDLQHQMGRAVVGGPVDNGLRTIVGWAQYFTRYSSFMEPVQSGNAKALPGNNACYPREILDNYSTELTEGFWEAEFNNVLVRNHERLWMSPLLRVSAFQHRGLWEYVSLRYRHGRCYGARRYAEAGGAERIRLLAAIPLIPAVLVVRAGRAVFRKKRYRKEFLMALPLMTLYFAAWAAGETVGYLFNEGQSCVDTD